jgi:hypothetical protein
VKLPSKYKNLVDLILTSKSLNRHKSSKASKRLGMKNLFDETSIQIQKIVDLKLTGRRLNH